MIAHNENVFCLSTLRTSYAFQVEAAGHLEHLHYGTRIHMGSQGASALAQRHSSLPSATIAYNPETPNLSMELLRGEVSTLGKGDFGDPFVDLEFSDGSRTCDFIFDSWEISDKNQSRKDCPPPLAPKRQKQIPCVSVCGRQTEESCCFICIIQFMKIVISSCAVQSL